MQAAYYKVLVVVAHGRSFRLVPPEAVPMVPWGLQSDLLPPTHCECFFYQLSMPAYR